MPSTGDSIRLATSAVASASGSARTLRATPGALPGIWMEGEEVRDRFRSLIPALMRINPGSSAIGLCSTLPGEGTTTMIAGLACAAAEEGSVIVIDAHCARPGHTIDLWGQLHYHANPTLATNGSLLHAIEIIGLNHSPESTAPGGLHRLVAEARTGARTILVDLEPLKESSQALSLAGCLDAIYLVVEVERERREVIARSVQSLVRGGLHVAGVLLNKRVREIPDVLYRWL